jgi:hypothetical protein
MLSLTSMSQVSPLSQVVREYPPGTGFDSLSLSARNGHASDGRALGLFVPKPTPFVMHLANVLLGLQLGVWLRPPMSGIGTACCY